MGNYASTGDLKDRFTDETEVSHLTGSADTGSADNDVLNEVIDGAEGEINSYAATMYSVPLDVAGDTGLAAHVKSLTLDLAVARLHSRTGNVPEPIEMGRTRAIEWLDKLAKGDIRLPSARTEVSTVSRDPVSSWGIASTGDSSQRVFSRATQEQL